MQTFIQLNYPGLKFSGTIKDITNIKQNKIERRTKVLCLLSLKLYMN